MLEDVKKRLEALGFTVADTDNWVLNFCIEKVTNHIKNSCNISVVPKELHEIAVDMACSEFLAGKMQSGQLEYKQAVKRIKEGDTDIEYVAGQSDIELLNKLIASLRMNEADLITYRRLVW